MIPWSMTELWNERWRAMSFGPHQFESDVRPGPLMGRFLLFYLLPIVGCVAIIGAVGVAFTHGAQNSPKAAAGAVGFAVLGVIAAYLAMGAIALAFYAKYFREAVGTLSLTSIDFEFSASTWAWFKLIVGNILLVIFTLGIGYAFLGYRTWKFLITHLEAGGEIDFALLTQSTTPELKQGEGLLDAFDVGAI